MTLVTRVLSINGSLYKTRKKCQTPEYLMTEIKLMDIWQTSLQRFNCLLATCICTSHSVKKYDGKNTCQLTSNNDLNSNNHD